MASKPTIFISAVTNELKSARQLVANTLQFLGYEPVWQDIFGTEQGDLRAMLRRKVDESQGVVQLIGRRYGAEPAARDEQFGRVSYTQYEALYARQKGKKVWYLVLGDDFPADTAAPEPEELQELQTKYRASLKGYTLYHTLHSIDGMESAVLKLRDELAELRKRARRWAAMVTAALFVIACATGWIIWKQAHPVAGVASAGDVWTAKESSDLYKTLGALTPELLQPTLATSHLAIGKLEVHLKPGPAVDAMLRGNTPVDRWIGRGKFSGRLSFSG